jgi:hypothetical protein
MPRKKYASLEDRLIANSRINETESHGGTRCWDWIGVFGTGGRGEPYPQMSLRVNGKHTVKRAHRLALEVFRGVVFGPDDHADHLCRRRCCINPMHLEKVPAAENLARRYRKSS